jgi:hypothetical protein
MYYLMQSIVRILTILFKLINWQLNSNLYKLDRLLVVNLEK